MKLFVPIFLFLTSFIFWGCNVIPIKGNGNILTDVRDVAPFEKIEADGSFEIRIKQGTKEAITVITDENLLPEILTEIEGGKLHIHSTNKSLVFSKSVIVELTVVNLQSINLSGSCNIEGKGDWHFNDFEMESSGATESKFNLFANNFSSDISGSGTLTLTGRVSKADIEISGSGELFASTFEAKAISLEISGAGSAEVFATETLKVSVSGSGDVKYKGTPRITQDISGSGSVNAF